jgi:hypothetical protein
MATPTQNLALNPEANPYQSASVSKNKKNRFDPIILLKTNKNTTEGIPFEASSTPHRTPFDPTSNPVRSHPFLPPRAHLRTQSQQSILANK